ncbi:uncharacterized protein RCC_04383 [Ramularia collo-cygni]|uniref:Uncharacterized protein n=1 Tax=Ramularia collo-cygni TaxID=112498 RepID=A0A2D3UTY9_9PEZI|nr:uncharacterized protein RCC_04383 [Ramularia collo-cygni]CZT18538.1 uncharacterized protein RCC_04383 [Ramularia collo-cygni]
MSLSPVRPDVLALLYDQQRNYNAQLGQNHESLSKLYRKLAKIEQVLAVEPERHMKRACRKKWKYSQVLTKKSITSIQDKQDILYQLLDQCASLIGSYHEQTLTPATPWMHLPPSPYMLTPSSSFPFSPWAANFSGASSSEDSETTFWDLSRLREPSPFSSMADSGYHESQDHQDSNDQPTFRELDLIFSSGALAPSDDSTRHLCVPLATRSDVPIMSEQNDRSDLQAPSSPTRSGAQTHRRCVSAEYAQLVDGSLVVPASSKRGTSVGPARQARGSNNGLVG